MIECEKTLIISKFDEQNSTFRTYIAESRRWCEAGMEVFEEWVWEMH